MTILAALIVGLLGFQMDKPIKQWFENQEDVRELASYTFGGLLILIAFILISFEFMNAKERARAIMALCGALIGVGSGVTLAKVMGIAR